MAKRTNEIDVGTGNVFADLGYADAKQRTLKVKLAAAKTDHDREKVIAKIRALSPFWTPAEKK